MEENLFIKIDMLHTFKKITHAASVQSLYTFHNIFHSEKLSCT